MEKDMEKAMVKVMEKIVEKDMEKAMVIMNDLFKCIICDIFNTNIQNNIYLIIYIDY